MAKWSALSSPISVLVNGCDISDSTEQGRSALATYYRQNSFRVKWGGRKHSKANSSIANSLRRYTGRTSETHNFGLMDSSACGCFGGSLSDQWQILLGLTILSHPTGGALTGSYANDPMRESKIRIATAVPPRLRPANLVCPQRERCNLHRI